MNAPVELSVLEESELAKPEVLADQKSMLPGTAATRQESQRDIRSAAALKRKAEQKPSTGDPDVVGVS